MWPLNLLNILACEEIDDALSDILVDVDVKDGVDEAVAVGEDHHVGHPYVRDVEFAANFQHEEDSIGPPADGEGHGDDPHDKGDSKEVLVILPSDNPLVKWEHNSAHTDMVKFIVLKW